SRRAEELLAAREATTSRRQDGPRKIVICHLGHGCSATAVRGGLSVDTTMGFTPLEGLMMATRCGSIDPGIVPYVQTQYGLSATECEEILNRKSGLAAVSGLSADMRELLVAASSGHARAALAIAMYVHRIRGAIGSLAATLGGIDALVFTAGVGENSPQIRELVCERLEFLGLRLDREANATCTPDADIATEDSPARILVQQTREELEMLRQVRMLLGAEEAKHRGR
ncbi:MAG: acetate kinase, partial [Planctomycetota bacterium]